MTGDDALPPPPAAAPPPEAPAPSDAPWHRTAARSLLVAPLRTLKELAPSLAPLIVVAFASGGPARVAVLVAALTLPLVIGVVRWATIAYRVTDEQFQIRHGLLRKSVQTAQLDKVRTVDAEATLLRRLLRVSDLAIGTGADKPLSLHGVDAEEAQRLRRLLLARAGNGATRPDAAASATDPALTGAPAPSPTTWPAAPPQEWTLARFDPGWLRLAPFTLTGLATLAAAVALVSETGDELHLWDRLGGVAGDAWEHRPEVPLPVAVLGGVLAALVTLTVLSMVAYALAYWNFRLVDRRDGTLHVSRGLLTTRAMTIELSRLRGAVLERPFLLGLARGARAKALLTGVGEAGGQQAKAQSDLLTPPAPVEVVRRAIVDVLGDDAPVRVRLSGHGPYATRRRWTRAAWQVLPLVAAPIVATVAFSLPGWVAALALLPALLVPPLAIGRARRLGHALTPGHLVAAEGLFPQRRSMLREAAIIGWQVKASPFQRRVGLVSLGATVAAKGGVVWVTDVPRERAVALIRAATPGLVEPYLA